MFKLPAFALAALLATGATLSAQDVSRTSPSDADLATAQSVSGEAHGPFAYDRSTRTVFVRGEAYYVPEQVNTIRLWGADRIALTWTQRGDQRVVENYRAEREDG